MFMPMCTLTSAIAIPAIHVSFGSKWLRDGYERLTMHCRTDRTSEAPHWPSNKTSTDIDQQHLGRSPYTRRPPFRHSYTRAVPER